MNAPLSAPSADEPTGAAATRFNAQANLAPQPDTLTPADRYAELFIAVQRSQVFDDSKTFVDCVPLREPAVVLADYRARCDRPGFDLGAFVHANFSVDRPERTAYASIPGQPLQAHIDALWTVLTRHPSAHPAHASLLPLPLPYVVPGGRFAELYYWDSYFTMIGLGCDAELPRLRDMLHNFAYLIDTYGHVPNGTRTYYLGRSQPPLFACMVELAEQHGVVDALDHLPQLRAEHAWWMAGEDALAPGNAHQHVVRLASGQLLNRHWDARDTPREESWLEDTATADACDVSARGDLFRHLRAACESGWDFSSRWLREPSGAMATAPRSFVPRGSDAPEGKPPRAASAATLASICTTDIVPIDLNALLYKLETTIARLASRSGDRAVADAFAARAQQRREALHAMLWDADAGAFFDFDWRLHARRGCLTGATVVPLFTGLATKSQARALAATIRRRLLAPGGFATSECASDQQWDRPNGWAPLQYMAVRGLADYGQNKLAGDIAGRWLATVAAVYEREGKLIEKYALREVSRASSRGGGGGEYPLQDGFGWTNGVTRALLAAYPQHSASGCVAHAAAPQHR